MRIGSLFSGIGGFELAGEWCGHETIWQSEIDPYCVALLAERFPKAKQLGDITQIDWSTVERPDILTGGFPCQDISYAGKGAGLAGARSGLWYEYARAVRDLGPRYIIVENVRALLTRGFDAVLGSLADLGYDAEWSMYGAADVGAPHRRQRMWILGYANGARRQGGAERSISDQEGEPVSGKGSEEWWSGFPAASVAHPHLARSQGRNGAELRECAGEWIAGTSDPHMAHADSGGRNAQSLCCSCTREGHCAAHADRTGATVGRQEWWFVEPDVGRVAHGVSARVDRLRGLGNAIVPACALPVYARIEEIEAERTLIAAASASPDSQGAEG